MLTRGKAQKVTVYVNEDTSSTETFVYEQVMRFLQEQEVAGATLIRPADGFGNHHHRHESTRTGLPVRIEFIDTPEVVEALLPTLCEIVSDGLVVTQEVFVVKAVKQEDPL